MKFAQLLRTLDTEDLKSLDRYLESPYAKVPERVLVFYRRLKKKYPDFDPDRPALKVLFESCFGKHAYTDDKLYNLTSDLTRHVERFLALDAALGPASLPPTPMEKHLLITALGQRNAGAYFREEAEAFAKKLEKQETKGPDEWFYTYKTYEQVYYNPDTHKAKPNVPYLSHALDGLAMHALTSYLRYAAEWKSRDLMMTSEGPPPHLSLVMDLTSDSNLLEKSPFLEVYRAVILAMEGDLDAEGFTNLVTLFNLHRASIPIEDQKTILRQLVNCGVRLWADGAPMEPVLLGVYQNAINFGILLDNGRMPHIGFINIVSIASLQKEFEYVQQFMEQYGPSLEEAVRGATIQLSKVILLYNQGNLEEAYALFDTDLTRIPSAELSAKNLQLKITMDRFLISAKEDNYLLALADAMEHFVKTKGLSEHKKLAWQNFLKMIRAMVKSKLTMQRNATLEREKLMNKLNSLTPVNSKMWLTERIQKL